MNPLQHRSSLPFTLSPAVATTSPNILKVDSLVLKVFKDKKNIYQIGEKFFKKMRDFQAAHSAAMNHLCILTPWGWA